MRYKLGTHSSQALNGAVRENIKTPYRFHRYNWNQEGTSFRHSQSVSFSYNIYLNFSRLFLQTESEKQTKKIPPL